MKDVFTEIAKTSSILILTLILMIPILFMESCTPSSVPHISDRRVWRYTSFVKLDIDMSSVPTGCISLPPDTSCTDFTDSMSPVTMSGNGSGMIIRHSREMTFILTAAHVCRDRRNYSMRITTLRGAAEISIEQRSVLTSVDYYGNTHSTSVFSSDDDNDICIVVTPGLWGNPVPISSIGPEVGDLVYNVASPLGIFEPRMVPIFEGRYVGRDSGNRSYYTIPTGPGSSGSAILNNSGEIVGVIHSAFTDFENIAISASLDDIRRISRTIESQ